MKRILIIFGILIVIFLGIHLILASRDIKKVRDNGGAATLRDYFPFGKNSGSRIKNVVGGDNTTTTEDTDTGEELQDAVESQPQLRKLYSGHVAGYGYAKRQVFDGEGDTLKNIEVTPVGVFERELRIGAIGEDVKRLQQTLNSCPQFYVSESGPGSKGQETGTLGQKTIDAINKFQIVFKQDILTPRNLTNPTSVVDEPTRKKLSSPFTCVLSNTGNKIVPEKLTVRFVDKENGNVSDVLLDSGEQYQVTNTTIPRIYEAYFINNGKNVLLRYLKDDEQTIATFYGKIPEQKLGDDISEAPLSGVILEDNIKDVAISPDTAGVYLQTTIGGISTGVSRNLDTKKQSILWQNPFSEWLAQWVNGTIVSMTTKASGYIPGYIYIVNQKTGSFEKVFGGIGGLTTKMSPDANFVLFSRSLSGGLTTSIYNISNRKVSDFSISTLPEKCVWHETSTFIYCAVPKFIPDGLYPDNWYQGVVSFEDNLWQIDVTRLLDDVEIFDPSTETNETIDMIDLSISPDKKYILFRNKKDDSLWAYTI